MNIGDRVSAGDGARILDRGYQHYGGQRRGPLWAMRAIALGTMQRSIGFRRPTSAKVFPIILILGCFAPALIVLGIRLLAGASAFSKRTVAIDQIVPLYTYFSLISTLVMVLAALAASEALCPDRRQRVLSLYYASPVTPRMYLAARVAGVTLVLGMVTILPPLLLWTGNTLLDDSPWTYLSGHLGQLFALLGAGAIMALFDASIGCAVAGFTERKTYAAGALLGGAIVLTAASAFISDAVHGGWAKYTQLIAPLRVPMGVSNWFFAHSAEQRVDGAYFLAAAIIITLCALVVLWRTYAKVRF
jgi:ABC-2 type transport system permease protein